MFGFAASALDRGLEAFAQRDWKGARRLLNQVSPERQSPQGDYALGLLYWRGLGGPRDLTRAAEHFARAAADGHVAAQTAYGIALSAGVGVARDEEEARRLFRAAAAGDDMDAILHLASLSEGEEAEHWLKRAADMGHPGAMRVLSDILVETAPVEALSWLYASSSLLNDDAARRRAIALAEELSADQVEAARRIGRNVVKRRFREARNRR